MQKKLPKKHKSKFPTPVDKSIKTDIQTIKSDLKVLQFGVSDLKQDVDMLDKKLDEKFDKIMTVFDTFVGEVQSYRQLQELNSSKLSEHSDQLERHEEILKKFTHPAV